MRGPVPSSSTLHPHLPWPPSILLFRIPMSLRADISDKELARKGMILLNDMALRFSIYPLELINRFKSGPEAAPEHPENLKFSAISSQELPIVRLLVLHYLSPYKNLNAAKLVPVQAARNRGAGTLCGRCISASTALLMMLECSGLIFFFKTRSCLGRRWLSQAQSLRFPRPRGGSGVLFNL